MKFVLFSGMALAAVLCFDQPAHANWVVCNGSTKNVNLAIGYIDPGPGAKTSHGWYVIPACGCQSVWTGNLPESDRPGAGIAAYYAENNDDTIRWGQRGNWSACVDDKRGFTLNHFRQESGRCTSVDGRRMVTMTEVYANHGATHTTTLTASGNNRCRSID